MLMAQQHPDSLMASVRFLPPCRGQTWDSKFFGLKIFLFRVNVRKLKPLKKAPTFATFDSEHDLEFGKRVLFVSVTTNNFLFQ